MTRDRKHALIDGILVALVILVFLGAMKMWGEEAKKGKYFCSAGPNEICPSDLWVADYQKLVALRKKYTAPQDIQDMMAGMTNRLASQIPQGYGWDENKQRFVKTPEPVKPAATPPPADAPKK